MATEPAKTGDDDKAFAKFSDTLSKVISAIDGLCSRMDELDAKAEKSRKDSEDAAGEREKQMKDELEALKSHTNMQPEERSGFGEAQARADSVYRLNGKQAPPVMAGEKLFDYRRRLLAPLLKDSAQFAKINLAATNLDILDAIEPVVLADAAAAARDVSKIPGGQMRKTERRDATGRTITEWHGSWMASQPVPPISLRRVRPELMAGRIRNVNWRASSGRPAALPARSLGWSSWAPGALAHARGPSCRRWDLESSDVQAFLDSGESRGDGAFGHGGAYHVHGAAGAILHHTADHLLAQCWQRDGDDHIDSEHHGRICRFEHAADARDRQHRDQSERRGSLQSHLGDADLDSGRCGGNAGLRLGDKARRTDAKRGAGPGDQRMDARAALLSHGESRGD